MPVIEMHGIKREYRMESASGSSSKKAAGISSNAVVVRALKGIDFFAEEGEFVSIMGPSGSGKSTLMNILGCLDKPRKGNILLTA